MAVYYFFSKIEQARGFAITRESHTFSHLSWRKDVLGLPWLWAALLDHIGGAPEGDQSNHRQSDLHAALSGSATRVQKVKKMIQREAGEKD